ncbi:uncharacterized protein CTRU02_206539 [Colletotrichum truncatum]|uniref:Uncharacterized protein n=1 Tax=Colletotrichum truncatum TaxID=5467 RepID=A0ACC3Z759_COLTU|nr:uncharacterized protein CTRU02_11910 [Colletotrichum truncatum]KAF6785285.1 hypothetical protein CTRU02_11910 [Colletotrichum truncatum]
MSTLTPNTSIPPIPLIVDKKKSSLLKRLFKQKEPPSEAPVPYTRLKDGEIRLVKLHPGPPSSPITLTTEIVSTSEAHSNYTALSYVWGDAIDTLPIHVDNHIFHATKNLHSALLHIRVILDSSDVVPLWIDAICINQNDTLERNHQVARMREIYSAADLVLTWLGPDLGDGLLYLRELGDHAFSKYFMSGPEDPYAPPQMVGERPQNPEILTSHVQDRFADIRAAVKVYVSVYWERVWTVQEYSAPTKLGVFLSGTVWIDRTAFLPATTLYLQVFERMRNSLQRQRKDFLWIDMSVRQVTKIEKWNRMGYRRLRLEKGVNSAEADDDDDNEDKTPPRQGLKGESGHFNILSLLTSFRQLNATDPRDRIYAPLNLVHSHKGSSSAPLFKVDYSLTVRQLYTAVARYLLENIDFWPFSILEICRYGTSPDLPSWVPDWRVFPRKIICRDPKTGLSEVCASRGLSPADGERSWSIIDEDKLQLKGVVRVDTVTELWDVFDSRDMGEKKEYPTYALHNPGEKYEPTGETVHQAFRAAAGVETHPKIIQLSRNASKFPMFIQEDWQMNRAMTGRLNRRRFARTSRGFVSIVPEEAEKGDIVWLIPGADMF